MIEYDWLSESERRERGISVELWMQYGWEMEGGAWRRPKGYCIDCRTVCAKHHIGAEVFCDLDLGGVGEGSL